MTVSIWGLVVIVFASILCGFGMANSSKNEPVSEEIQKYEIDQKTKAWLESEKYKTDRQLEKIVAEYRRQAEKKEEVHEH